MGTIYVRTNEQGKIVHSDTNPIEDSIQIEIEDELLEDIKILYCTYKDGQVTFDEEAYNKEQNQNEAVQAQETMLETMMLKSSRAMFLSELPDEEAVKIPLMYDSWSMYIGRSLKAGARVEHNGLLYKVIQNIPVVLENQPPGLYMEALYVLINVKHEGTIDDPIPIPEPFSSMEYVKGKYYIENDVVYLMNRPGMEDGETIDLAYKPSQLVGVYFEVATNSDPNVEWPDFKRPTGTHDAYMKDDKVTYNGKHYISLIDNNTWSPDDYPQGWKLVEEE